MLKLTCRHQAPSKQTLQSTVFVQLLQKRDQSIIHEKSIFHHLQKHAPILSKLILNIILAQYQSHVNL